MIKYFCDRCGKEIKGNVNESINTMEGVARGKVVATWESVEHICDECEQADLTCGFKIGDKVITDDGRTGTITSICNCEYCKKRGFYEPEVDFCDYTDYIMISDKEDGFKSYYQIGDRVFGNLDEEPVIKGLEEIGKRYNQLVKQQGMIHLLRYKKENNNGN